LLNLSLYSPPPPPFALPVTSMLAHVTVKVYGCRQQNSQQRLWSLHHLSLKSGGKATAVPAKTLDLATPQIKKRGKATKPADGKKRSRKTWGGMLVATILYEWRSTVLDVYHMNPLWMEEYCAWCLSYESFMNGGVLCLMFIIWILYEWRSTVLDVYHMNHLWIEEYCAWCLSCME
jgi:hypothetical protein